MIKNKQKNRLWTIIAGAGIGTRLPSDKPKQYQSIAGKTVVEHSVDPFINHVDIEKIVIVISPDDSYWSELSISKSKNIITVQGGKERFQSVLAGLIALENLAQPEDWILVHDAARPCLRTTDLNYLINTLRDHAVGGLLATPVRDTLKKASVDQVATISRENLWAALTPQMFRYKILREALEFVVRENIAITDDASAIELQGHCSMLIKGSSDNIKVTFAEDLRLAEMILHARDNL